MKIHQLNKFNLLVEAENKAAANLLPVLIFLLHNHPLRLNRTLNETLNLFKKADTRLSSSEVWEIVGKPRGITPNAICNRLERLRQCGLLARTATGKNGARGRYYLYSRVP